MIRGRSIQQIFPGGANPEQAVLCPWFSSNEWEQVYDWLYSSDTALVERGIARIAAWKARTPKNLPLVVEVTADLVECQLNERKSKSCVARGVCLSYSMAITRFINGVTEVVGCRGIRGDIKELVFQYGIPAWVVEVRHDGTHRFLPSIGQLRTAGQFALNWLRANYWRPQKKLIHDHRKQSQGSTTSATSVVVDVPVTVKEPTSGQMDSAIARLTSGLCSNKAELVDLLVTSSFIELGDYILKKQLLYFPPNVKITVEGPDISDLVAFPSLSGDLGMWRKHLLKAANKQSSFKFKLASALIMATHSTGVAIQRDYLSSWLGLLLVEHYEVDKPSNIEVVTIVDDEDQLIPGSLDWLKLLRVVKDHPGYYTHAISSLIDSHLCSSLSLSVREKILYLSHLVTLSERIGSSIPGALEGEHTAHLKETLKNYKRKPDSTPTEPLRKQSRMSVQPRWRLVEDMKQWVHLPLGMCPGQVLTPSCLDLPPSVNTQRERVKKVRKPLEGSKNGEYETNKGCTLPTITLAHARDFIKLF